MADYAGKGPLPDRLRGSASGRSIMAEQERDDALAGSASLVATLKGWQDLYDEGKWSDKDLADAVMHLDVDAEGEPGEILTLRQEVIRLTLTAPKPEDDERLKLLRGSEQAWREVAEDYLARAETAEKQVEELRTAVSKVAADLWKQADIHDSSTFYYADCANRLDIALAASEAQE
jgi:hypothetical protein